jgi:basic amino acid/polyamine antiporter, APA family
VIAGPAAPIGAGPGAGHGAPALRRSLGPFVLTVYGLGLIVGAGIYVLVGTLAGAAGMLSPLAFAAAAAVAALTGISYAALAVRQPEAAGAVAYVHHAFGSDALARAVMLLSIAVALVAGASIARGSAGYVQRFLDVPDWLPGVVLVAAFTGLACFSIRVGATVAALAGLIEIGGLLFAAGAASGALAEAPQRLAELAPADGAGFLALAKGAFLAFFAYLGFEAIANMSEEARDPARTLPRAILGALALAALLYGFVALVAVLAVPPQRLAASAAPLCLLVERGGLNCGASFAAIALIALSNGIFAEIVLVARLIYGSARRGLLHRLFAHVGRRSAVPVRATLATGAIMAAAVATLPFATLAGLTSALTLAIFVLVNLALWRVRRRDRAAGRRVTLLAEALPLAGVASCLGLLAAFAFG